jgi:hypothetical protein
MTRDNVFAEEVESLLPRRLIALQRALRQRQTVLLRVWGLGFGVWGLGLGFGGLESVPRRLVAPERYSLAMAGRAPVVRV